MIHKCGLPHSEIRISKTLTNTLHTLDKFLCAMISICFTGPIPDIPVVPFLRPDNA